MSAVRGEGSKAKKIGSITSPATIVPASYFKRKDLKPEKGYDWKDYLQIEDLVVAKASSFKHTPLVDEWRNIEHSLSKSRIFVEILHNDIGSLTLNPGKVYWIGEVLKLGGYKALIRPIGFEDDSADYWINLSSSEVYPVGTLADRNMTLLPPQSLEQRDSDYWKGYILEILSKNHSIPTGLQSKMRAEMMSRFAVGLRVEVVDKKRLSHVRPATVEVVVGRRLKLIYEGDASEDFWCSDQSQWLHPVGWAKSVNHALIAKGTYHERCEKKIKLDEDAPLYLFQSHPAHPMQDQFDEGMKLEVIDPLNLKEICAATIYQVLQHGYIVLRIDSYEDDKPANRFCVHVTNPNIFYVGFCEENGIELNPPFGCTKETFSWISYLKQTGSRPVTKEMVRRDECHHNFSPGMKIEAVDLMNPHLICVATVVQVVGRLLRIRFDGWDEDYDHWVDCRSPDIYPVGYCDAIGFRLTGPPRSEGNVPSIIVKTPSRRSLSPLPLSQRVKLKRARGAPLSNSSKVKKSRKRKNESPVTSDSVGRRSAQKTVTVPKNKRNAKISLPVTHTQKEQIEKLSTFQVSPEKSVTVDCDVPRARKTFPNAGKSPESTSSPKVESASSVYIVNESVKSKLILGKSDSDIVPKSAEVDTNLVDKANVGGSLVVVASANKGAGCQEVSP